MDEAGAHARAERDRGQRLSARWLRACETRNEEQQEGEQGLCLSGTTSQAHQSIEHGQSFPYASERDWYRECVAEEAARRGLAVETVSN
ncbi:MAG TPA: hypothetical protein VFZ73_07480 [Gemmatimonadaceae bacterium]